MRPYTKAVRQTQLQWSPICSSPGVAKRQLFAFPDSFATAEGAHMLETNAFEHEAIGNLMCMWGF